MLPGYNIRVSCSAETEPTWTFQDGLLPHNADVRKSNDSDLYYLYIYRVSLSNFGIYECKGELQEGHTEFHALTRLRLSRK